MKKLAIYFSVFVVLTFAYVGYCVDFHVDAVNGSDTNSGLVKEAPFKTITHALEMAEQQADRVSIFLTPGNYNMDSGETFPLMMKNKTSSI